MLSFFIITSLWWWVVTALVLIVLLWGSLNENGLTLGISLFAYVLVLQLGFSTPFVQTMINNPGLLLFAFCCYFVIGTAWSIVKWYVKVKDYVCEHNEKKAEFIDEYRKSLNTGDATPTDRFMNDRWKDSGSTVFYNKAEAKNEKATIGYWITYWPFSMVVFVFEDLFNRIVDKIISSFQGVYKKIEDRAYIGLK